MKVKESLKATFDETPPPPKTPPLEDDELVEEEAIEALKDENWVMAMQEELNKFKRNDVWELVPNPMDMTIIGIKWVYKNKLDENGVITRNKARLVAHGYNQQEGIDYDETYAPVARLEFIRILLAYSCALDFKLYQMDVKSAFLNGFINEKVYVAQPPRFIDFTKPNYVCRLRKALYETKLTRDEEGESIDNTKYRGMIGILRDSLVADGAFGAEAVVEGWEMKDVRQFMVMWECLYYKDLVMLDWGDCFLEMVHDEGFSFFLQMGFTLILATLDGLDVGLLGDVNGEDDCDDDG
nr:retrovirus-related Pol polyprotein from transposon TNT 1-94 [Tanacetum cinerariifolium]